MTRTIAGILAAVAFGVAAVNAQTRAVDKDAVTVTGCLAKAADGTYTLTNAKVGAATAASGSEKWGVDIGEAAASALSLPIHVGHKVEMTGRKTAPAAGAPAGAPANQVALISMKVVAPTCP